MGHIPFTDDSQGSGSKGQIHVGGRYRTNMSFPGSTMAVHDPVMGAGTVLGFWFLLLSREVIELRVESFGEIADDFGRRVARDRCCNMATVDGRGRVRSRVVHPLWEGRTAYLLTLRSSPKVTHISVHDHASLAYVGDEERPAYAECRGEWIDDPLEVKRIWERFRESPVGYEPGSFYGTLDVGVIRLTAWRIQVDDVDGESVIWEASDN